MLLSFSIENYRCFKDKVTLSMKATADKRHPQNLSLFDFENIKVLKTAGLYGSNASGKTTIVGAIHLMREFVIRSNSYNQNQIFSHTPFAFNPGCLSKPTSFEMEFINNGVRFIYGFSYLSDRVSEEHLYTYPNKKKKVIFERNELEFEFHSDVKLRSDISKRMDSKKLYLSFASQFNDPECKTAMEWFANKLLPMVDYNVDQSLDILFNMIQNDLGFREHILRALKIADFGITGLSDTPQLINMNSSAMPIKLHNYMVQHTVAGTNTPLPLIAESKGTIRFLAVIGPVIDALTRGTTIVIDEMDLSFHTDLSKWIVGIFNDPEENRKNAQLIFNTHDAELLDQSVVRRDQIWIFSRDYKTSASSLMNLRELNIRNDLDIRKAYLNGSLGGTPFIEPERLME